MKSLLEHLQKCQELFGLQKSVSASNLSLKSPANTGVKNVVYKQQTGHTSSVGKKTMTPPVVNSLPEIKPIVNLGTKHLRLGGNKIANTEV